MQEKIQKLYEEINFIGYYTSKNNDIHYIDSGVFRLVFKREYIWDR